MLTSADTHVTEIHVYGPQGEFDTIHYDEVCSNGFITGGLRIPPACVKSYSYDNLLARAIEAQAEYAKMQNGDIPTIVDHWKPEQSASRLSLAYFELAMLDMHALSDKIHAMPQNES